MGRTSVLTSAEATEFTDALNQNQTEQETLVLKTDGNGKIYHVRIRSKENRAWQVEFVDSSSNIVRVCTFAEGDAVAKVIGGTTYYFYVKDVEWAIPREDIARTMFWVLRNLSAQAKTEGAAGEVKLWLDIQPE